LTGLYIATPLVRSYRTISPLPLSCGDGTGLAVLRQDAGVPEHLTATEHHRPDAARRCPTLPAYGAEDRLDFLGQQSVNVSLTEATWSGSRR